MPEQPQQSKSIIIKKVKKVTGGSHGGSWKVAYADFVTAMMAFFLLLWLLSMVSPEKRAGVSYYFRSFTIFPKDGAGLLDKETIKMMDDQPIVLKPKFSVPPSDDEKDKGKSGQKNVKNLPVGIHAVGLRDRIRKNIRSRLAVFKNHLSVSLSEDGVRVDIMDIEEDTLFPKGGTEINPTLKSILKELTNEILVRIDNKIIIEGHTDAFHYKPGKAYTNWELSADRALAVRRELEENGFDLKRLSMIIGYGSTRPYIKEDPKNPRNRRVSLVILLPRTHPSI
ncbi:MAG: OmpA family protein [Candidatus Aureabacteria bacterium]|nr:OmpA family protein [Candidatus Auribacterota bacterium]